MNETNGAGSLRDRIRSAEAIGEQLAVEGWGVTVEVRPMSVAEKANLFPEGTDDDKLRIKDTETVIPKIIVATCYDPATGERVFTEDDLAWLAEQPANVAETVANRGLEISGLTQEAADAGKEGS